MPVIRNSTYKPPALLKNKHLQTIYPFLFRKVKGISYQRERIETKDGDFLDLDWTQGPESDRLVVVLHGLESSSEAGYVMGMIKAFQRRGWAGLAVNYRGCSGEPNRLLRSYHSGETDDVRTILSHVLEKDRYKEIALVGFSLGGNILLKYLGEQATRLPKEFQGAVAISTPCDLHKAAFHLSKTSNQIYLRRFLKSLKKKAQEKEGLAPETLSLQAIHQARDFVTFDNLFTAPVHGFESAIDYWTKCSSKQYCPSIQLPTLLINAQDDPFLPRECFPLEEAEKSKHFHLEVPRYGGHVGFVTYNDEGEYWNETRTLDFILSA
ncbi:alpha/beta fold hydrolase [Rapidithrix thailandica]|uniref:Alpha/beta fold hydrolase n=1 Tax=Rapidithrix thailandica TaxID=413964 RepID=A0AAW9S660_9BACT